MNQDIRNISMQSNDFKFESVPLAKSQTLSSLGTNNQQDNKFIENDIMTKIDSSKMLEDSNDVDDKSTSQETRETWSKKFDFLMSIIGFSVDLASIWRFPYLCFKNGGGAFLIPYTIMLFLLGLPLFFMELALGQYYKRGAITCWKKVCPLLSGVGYAVVLIAFYTDFFYNVVISWGLYYLFGSFSSRLPWGTCKNSWNSENCYEISSILKQNIDSNSSANLNFSISSKNTTNLISSSEEYFFNRMYRFSDNLGMDNFGSILWENVGCLLLIYIICYFSMWKGVQTSGKVVWFTALAPYVILIILAVRALFLTGSLEGLKYYLTPDMALLKNPLVWMDAASQVFFSLGPGFGVLLAFSSYNPFNNNIYKDAIITVIINYLSSLVSGAVIFMYLGYMSQVSNKSIQEVAKEGSSLVFIVYPEAISILPVPQFWSVIFFLMLITLGLDSSFGGSEAIITALSDEYPILRKRREIFVAFLFSFYLITGLPSCTEGGYFLVEFLNNYSAVYSILFAVLIENIAIAWLYGTDRFCNDIKEMIGIYPGKFWCYCWKYITPSCIALILATGIYGYRPLEIMRTNSSYLYPEWSNFTGWIVAASSCILIPLVAIYRLIVAKGSFKERLIFTITPERDQKVKNEETLVEDTFKENQIENSFLTNIPTDITEPKMDAIEAEKRSETISNASIPREKWSHKTEFLLAIIVPKVVYENGGGRFLIPYFVQLAFCGLPLFFMELILGQYHQTGLFTLMEKICPILKGLALTSFVIDLFMAMFYNTVIAWAVYYLMLSFKSELPWKDCDKSWNTLCCLPINNNNRMKTDNFSIYNTNYQLSMDGSYVAKVYPFESSSIERRIVIFNNKKNGQRVQNIVYVNQSVTVFLNCEKKFNNPTQEFFTRYLTEMHKSTGLEQLGGIKWEIILSLFVVFVTVYFALWKGIKSAGKAVWITAIAPYIVMFILLIRGLTLEGCWIGIKFYLSVDDWGSLFEMKVWVDAATQIFFSLGPGFGTIIALSSYNKRNNNCYKDALLTSFINCLTSILSGFVVFSTLGHMAHVQGKTIQEVTEPGPGLIFITYPQAISLMPWAPFWAVIFFFMLFTLGIDSTFGGLEAVITGVCDTFPQLTGKKRSWFVLGLISMCFIAAIPTVTYGGPYIVHLFDSYAVAPAILIVVFLEIIGVMYAYGCERFCEDLKSMINRVPNFFWIYCWKYISPAIVVCITFMISRGMIGAPLEYGNGYVYKGNGEVYASLIVGVPISLIFIYAGYRVYKTEGTIKERIKKLMKPKDAWKFNYESKQKEGTIKLNNLDRQTRYIIVNFNQNQSEPIFLINDLFLFKNEYHYETYI
ncbi:sodium-dependent noradrenaline transporter [Brachionus plicatilis]|uniref:Transporter n=1 Tax=Brachionus plicatilis TaxID=10195 RepID=A0A3M7Q1S8_BRAPC|nr:sodium-dependent noradrenaline transporter [Brachionus plicatilis]